MEKLVSDQRSRWERLMKAILSIKPEYVSQILDGRKTYEFRRRIFKRTDVDSIIIYCTRPQSAVVAEAEIDAIIAAPPERLWEQTGDQGGISYEGFMAYFKGVDTAYAISLRHVNAFNQPQKLSEIAPKVKTAPQSFVYVGC